jgi:hypothetical protein
MQNAVCEYLVIVKIGIVFVSLAESVDLVRNVYVEGRIIVPEAARMVRLVVLGHLIENL